MAVLARGCTLRRRPESGRTPACDQLCATPSSDVERAYQHGRPCVVEVLTEKHGAAMEAARVVLRLPAGVAPPVPEEKEKESVDGEESDDDFVGDKGQAPPPPSLTL
jgi:hypothetical protein